MKINITAALLKISLTAAIFIVSPLSSSQAQQTIEIPKSSSSKAKPLYFTKVEKRFEFSGSYKDAHFTMPRLEYEAWGFNRPANTRADFRSRVTKKVSDWLSDESSDKSGVPAESVQLRGDYSTHVDKDLTWIPGYKYDLITESFSGTASCGLLTRDPLNPASVPLDQVRIRVTIRYEGMDRSTPVEFSANSANVKLIPTSTDAGPSFKVTLDRSSANFVKQEIQKLTGQYRDKPSLDVSVTFDGTSDAAKAHRFTKQETFEGLTEPCWNIFSRKI